MDHQRCVYRRATVVTDHASTHPRSKDNGGGSHVKCRSEWMLLLLVHRLSTSIAEATFGAATVGEVTTNTVQRST